MFGRCPKCRKFLATKEIKRDVVSSEEFHANLGSYMRPVGSRIDKIIVTFKVTYKCKYCGHEWNDFVEQGIGKGDRAKIK